MILVSLRDQGVLTTPQPLITALQTSGGTVNKLEDQLSYHEYLRKALKRRMFDGRRVLRER